MRTPKRIQRKRAKGWKMPGNAVSVCRPGKYGNQFVVDKHLAAREATKLHRQAWIKIKREEPERFAQMVTDLRGKDIACFCSEDAEWCHGDNYLELANPELKGK